MVFQPIPYTENTRNWIIVAMAKLECGSAGKTRRKIATVPAT